MSSSYAAETASMDRYATASQSVSSPGDPSSQAAGLALLSVRFIQGFIYWGGGSRRFIYAPSKLDPNAPTWMANKFQTAMPGALLGTDHVIAYMLQHFWLLYAGVILFSAAELIAGLFLMLGFLTRGAALVSICFSIVLMLMFGWQGATCIDEWTMAACNLTMGASLVLCGSSAYSIDNALLHRNPDLARRGWFRWLCGSLPLPMRTSSFVWLALLVVAATALFNVATYDHFRGSVYSAFHGGPVSPSKHHYTLTDAALSPDGGVRFHAYLDGGSADVPSHIMEATLTDGDGHIVESWDMKALKTLPKTAIANDFAYNKFVTAPFGLAAKVGAMAMITLPGRIGIEAGKQNLRVAITDVTGKSFKVAIGDSQTVKNVDVEGTDKE